MANRLRKNRKWQRAKGLLQWTWQISLELARASASSEGSEKPQPDLRTLDSDQASGSSAIQEHEQVLETLCELYRWALFTGIAENRILACKGISWAIRQYTNLKLPKFIEIAKTYGHVALRLTLDTDSRSLLLNSGNTVQLDTVLQTVQAAIKEGDLVSTLVMLRDIKVTQPNDINEHLVDLAAARGWQTVAKTLIELQVLLEDEGHGREAIFYATESGDMYTLLLVLNKGCYPNFADAKKRTPLSYAAECGNVEIVKHLLSDPRVGHDPVGIDGYTPLFRAIMAGQAAVVSTLINEGRVDANPTDKNGLTPLLYAARAGHAHMVKVLLETGRVDPHSRDDTGWTPLFYAVRYGHVSVANLLIEGGADPDAEDDSKRTPLYYAAKTHETQMIKLLLDTGKVDPRVIADADSRRHGHKPPGIYKRAEIVSQLRWNKLDFIWVPEGIGQASVKNTSKYDEPLQGYKLIIIN